MEIFLNHVLQGAYAYVVVGLILVVSALSLLLIGLIIERTKEMASLVTEQAVPVPMKAAEPEEPEWKTKFAALEAENESLKKSEKEKISLLEKVKYLESKLLEYEILQEEIGTLSTLKLENERLKSGLMQKQPKEPVVATASAVTAPEVVEGAKKEPKIMKTTEPPPQVTVAPTVSALKDASTKKAAQDEIEDLLQQIDELTQGVRKSA